MLYATFIRSINVVLLCCCILVTNGSGFGNNSTFHWFAPFFSGGGYSQEAFDMILSIQRVNISAQIYQHGDGYNEIFMKQMLSEKNRDLLLSLKRPIAKVPSGFTINICHSEPGAWSAPKPKYYTESICPPYRPNPNNFALSNDHSSARIGGFIMNTGEKQYNIGRTMFETDSVPSGWIDRLNFMDEVWVPSLFSRNVFTAAGVNTSKVKVVPVAIDTDFFRPIDVDDIVRYNLKSKKSIEAYALPVQQLLMERKNQYDNQNAEAITTFLFVGKWETRKGISLLIDALLHEFFVGSQSSNVKLLILTSGYHSTVDVSVMLTNMLEEPEYKSIITEYRRMHSVSTAAFTGIEIIKNIPQEEMPLLYSLVRAVVIPSLGEGWGRPHVEALACGTPVIATNWSGVTAYLTADNGYPIEIEPELVESK